MLDYLEDFLLRIQTNNYSPETLYNYERDLKTFENFLKNEIKIPFEKINKKTIEQYKAYLVSRDRKTALGEKSKQNLTSGSINRTLSSLRGYLKYLIKMDYDSPIAPESIELLKTKKKHYRVSEFEEIVKLIESPSQFEKNKIDKTGRIFIMGKGKKERFVYLTERAKKHLGNYLSTRTDDSPYLFIPYRGKNIKNKNKKISSNYLQEKIKKYRELLSINIPISAHSLRHGFATFMAEQGANPAAIQILLGHESLDTTTRYVHTSDRYAEKTHRRYHPLKK